MPTINRLPINSNNDEHYEALVTRQTRNDKNHDTARSYDSFSVGSTVVVKWEEGGPWTMGQWLEEVIITITMDLT